MMGNNTDTQVYYKHPNFLVSCTFYASLCKTYISRLAVAQFFTSLPPTLSPPSPSTSFLCWFWLYVYFT